MAASITTVIQAATITQSPVVPTVIEAGAGFVLVVSPAVVGVASENVVKSTPLNTKPTNDVSVSAPFPLTPTAVVSGLAVCFL